MFEKLNVVKLNKDLAEALKDKENLIKQLADKETALTEAQNAIGNFLTEKKTFDKQIEDIKKEYEAKISDLNKQMESVKTESESKIKATEESVNKRVSAELASIGISEEEAPKQEISGELTPVQAFETFKQLNGTKQTEYYKNNKALIEKAMLS